MCSGDNEINVIFSISSVNVLNNFNTHYMVHHFPRILKSENLYWNLVSCSFIWRFCFICLLFPLYFLVFWLCMKLMDDSCVIHYGVLMAIMNELLFLYIIKDKNLFITRVIFILKKQFWSQEKSISTDQSKQSLTNDGKGVNTFIGILFTCHLCTFLSRL